VTLDGNVTIQGRRGEAVFLTRNDTNDGALVVGILAHDEYGLADLPPLAGTAIDVGAHIGSVAIALAIEHPDLRVIAVEAVPENCAVLRTNIERNGLADRVSVVQAAASAPGRKRVQMLWNYRTAGNEPQGYVDDSRFIANIYNAKDSDADKHTVTAVSLDTLMDGLDRLALLKVDCEGCEWQFLRSSRVKDVDIIIGEWHNGPRLAGLRELLPDHEVTQTGGHDDVGMFRAVRR
jgi:FkbM family methyltransferase